MLKVSICIQGLINYDIKYIERGYEDFDAKMRSLGADMAKVTCEKELKQFQFRAI